MEEKIDKSYIKNNDINNKVENTLLEEINNKLDLLLKLQQGENN